jgi:FRG domain-containing protein
MAEVATVKEDAAQAFGPITDIHEFLRLVLDKRQDPGDAWVFRGQRKADALLLPKIDRLEWLSYRRSQGWSRQNHEQWLLKEFRKSARPYLAIAPEDDWEWLATAQHHGLATRLLDWTGNPLCALFFAVEATDALGDAVVWCYHHTGQSSSSSPRDPFTPSQLLSFDPPHVTLRIAAQSGRFTSHPTVRDEDPTPWRGELRKILINQEARHHLRDHLTKLGMSRAALFPDLDSIAGEINRRLRNVHWSSR